MHPSFVLDADVCNFLRGLGLLDFVGGLASQNRLELHLTGYVANHELNALQSWVKPLETTGALKVHQLRAKTEPFILFRTLKEQGRTRSGKPVHKGECEMVAWLSTEGKGIALVSCDAGARDLAYENDIEVLDLAEFICELIRLGLLVQETAAQHLSVWDNPHVGLGRPKDFPGLSKALVQWSGRCQALHPG